MKFFMNKSIELLSPAGDFDCLKAAVQNGADSVYFGADMFVLELRLQTFHLIICKKLLHMPN